jgi:ribonuclease HII
MSTIRIKPNFKRQLYEKTAWSNSQTVCGIDEVGRSCLAGPVVAAAAILKPGAKHRLLKDSKLLTPKERVIAYKWLQKNSISCVGIVSARTIDSVNIYWASMQAMKRALVQLLSQVNQKPSVILIDAMPVKISLDIPVICFYHGEKQSASVAAASIIAKVTRDELMGRLGEHIPDYVWWSNKGYGTQVHRKAITGYGKSILHRLSFLKQLS